MESFFAIRGKQVALEEKIAAHMNSMRLKVESRCDVSQKKMRTLFTASYTQKQHI
jgi:hypothetical protein